MKKTEKEKDEYVKWHATMAVNYAKSIGLKDEVVEDVRELVMSLRDNKWLGHDDVEKYVKIVMERHRHMYLMENDESYRIGKEEEKIRHDAFFEKLQSLSDGNKTVAVGELLQAAKDEKMLSGSE